MKDGIYFGMSDADYHAIPRLSASGIKNILVSLPYFWAKSWMNPHRKHNDDDTPARILGRAYHAAIFEPETLAGRFVPEPDWSGYSDLLETDTAVKGRLKELGQTQSKAGENALDRAYRLREMSPDAVQIKSIIQAEFNGDLDDRQSIGRQYWDQMQRDMQRIKDNPEIFEMVTGGASEVTILWTCPDTGVPMKARIDKLKTDCFVDLKSFDTSTNKPVNQALVDTIKFNRYYLSMRLYQTAIMQARDLQAYGPMDAEAEAVLERLWDGPATPMPAYLFFQEKSGVPNLLLRRLKLQTYPEGVDEQSIGAEDHSHAHTDSVFCRKADMEIAWAKRQFLDAQELYGAGEWYPFDMIGEVTDEHFNSYWLDERPL